MFSRPALSYFLISKDAPIEANVYTVPDSVMNRSDGFGIHISATPSPENGIGEERTAVRLQQQQQQQQQDTNMWDNLTCAIKNTAQYASHEFDRFIDAIGLKASDSEANNTTRQIQLDKVCVVCIENGKSSNE